MKYFKTWICLHTSCFLLFWTYCNWVPILCCSLCAPLCLKSASLSYRSLFSQARNRPTWNCVFMNRAEAPYTAIRRECSDISHWQYEDVQSSSKCTPIYIYTQLNTHKLHLAINSTIVVLEQTNTFLLPNWWRKIWPVDVFKIQIAFNSLPHSSTW